MNVTLKIGSFTSKNNKSFECILLTTQTGLTIKIVDFNAVQRVHDLVALAKSLGIPLEQL